MRVAGDSVPAVEFHTVRARDADSGRSIQIVYVESEVVGQGSFGIVLRAELYSDTEQGASVVALKRTKQDKRYKCREMQILSAVLHPNIVKLRYYWYEADKLSDDLVLNLMFEFLVNSSNSLYDVGKDPHMLAAGSELISWRYVASRRRSIACIRRM